MISTLRKIFQSIITRAEGDGLREFQTLLINVLKGGNIDNVKVVLRRVLRGDEEDDHDEKGDTFIRKYGV
jgi:hypothetical protein